MTRARTAAARGVLLADFARHARNGLQRRMSRNSGAVGGGAAFSRVCEGLHRRAHNGVFSGSHLQRATSTERTLNATDEHVVIRGFEQYALHIARQEASLRQVRSARDHERNAFRLVALEPREETRCSKASHRCLGEKDVYGVAFRDANSALEAADPRHLPLRMFRQDSAVRTRKCARVFVNPEYFGGI